MGGGSLPDLRTWVIAAVVGAFLGGAIGTVLFGSPPARILLEPVDEGLPCPTLPLPEMRLISERIQEAAAGEVEERWRTAGGSGPPPAWSLGFAPCLTALEVWGAPLLPTRRDRWLDAIAGITDPATRRALEVGVERDLAAARTELEVTTSHVAAGLRSVDDASLPGEVAELADGLVALDRAVTTIAELEVRRDRLRALPVRAELHPPTTGLLAVTLGAVLGVLLSLLFVGAGERYRRRPPGPTT